MSPKRRAIVLTGPTGTGKSELAVELAEALNGEIVSADSRQVYREMDVGTAKPDTRLRRRAVHHGIDRLSPDAAYSAGRFARDAWGWIDGAWARGHPVIVVGGTGFFLRALMSPLGPEPELDLERRDRLRGYLASLPPHELNRWLARLDPRRAARVRGTGGTRRLSRSLEVALLSGRPHSWWLARPSETPPLQAMVFCLRLAREELYRRLDRRFDAMMDAGLLDEVQGLLERYPEDAPGLRAVGYAELIGHLRGRLTLAEAIETAKRNTRRYARRQLTWFRHQLPEGVVWLDAGGARAKQVSEILQRWHS